MACGHPACTRLIRNTALYPGWVTTRHSCDNIKGARAMMDFHDMALPGGPSFSGFCHCLFWGTHFCYLFLQPLFVKQPWQDRELPSADENSCPVNSKCSFSRLEVGFSPLPAPSLAKGLPAGCFLHFSSRCAPGRGN